MTIPFRASRRYTVAMLAEQFRLLPASKRPQVTQGDAVAGFLALADSISRTEKVCLVLALQRAVDRNPEAFQQYCKALGR